MATANLTDRDLRVRDAVTQQLDWDPAVDASGIGVAVRNGAVTLTGFANTYAEKLAAERAVKRVHGVRAVANDLEVRLRVGRTDADIAADIVTALALHGNVPDTVQGAVHHGHVTLTGTVAWHFQKLEALRSIRHVRGVRHVIDRIAVVPRASDRDVRKRIVRALHRHADIEASRIAVHVADGVARLTGRAESWGERTIAERAVADAPGVVMVDNQIVVEPPERAPGADDSD